MRRELQDTYAAAESYIIIVSITERKFTPQPSSKQPPEQRT